MPKRAHDQTLTKRPPSPCQAVRDRPSATVQPAAPCQAVRDRPSATVQPAAPCQAVRDRPSATVPLAAIEALAELPKYILDKLSSLRPVCKFWNTKKGCRNGRKCLNLHGDYNRDRIIFLIRYIDKDGVHRLVVRPPLDVAFKKFFDAHQRPIVLDEGMQFETSQGDVLMYYSLKNMKPVNDSAVDTAKQQHGVRTKSGSWVGKACYRTISRLSSHLFDSCEFMRVVIKLIL
jgi:hypothetical protein